MCNCKVTLPTTFVAKGIITTLPVNPKQGDVYIVSDCPSGDGLVGRERNIAVFGLEECNNDGWCFLTPKPGYYAIIASGGTPSIFQPFQYTLIYGWKALTTSALLS